MARTKPGKKEIAKVVDILQSDEYNSAEEMAETVLDVVFNEIVSSKFRHMVVGQLWSKDGTVSDEEGRALRVAFGPFPTKGQAVKAGESLALMDKDSFPAKWWYIEISQDSPHAWWMARRKKLQREGLLDTANPRELRLAMQQRWREENPGEDLPPELSGNGWQDLEFFELFAEDYAELLHEEEED